jgi:guanine deaminase
MDCNSPDYYREETAESLSETAAFVESTLNLGSSLVTPIITPRFAPTCSGELLSGLGKLAAEKNLPIQSHLSENKDEIEWVKSLFPDRSSYTDVYDHYGLLTPKTVMAHCIHLSDAEIETIKCRGTGVAHCPTSNINLNSGFLNLEALMARGVKVGLGTDVSGGHSPSMLCAARDAITVSKVLHVGGETKTELDYKGAFFLATLGGSQALGLDKAIGNFQPGKRFDALVVDPSANGEFFVCSGSVSPFLCLAN